MTHEETIQGITMGTYNLTVIAACAAEVSPSLTEILAQWTASWMHFMVDADVLSIEEAQQVIYDVTDMAALQSDNVLTGEDILGMGGI